jgi:hypothetical protein
MGKLKNLLIDTNTALLQEEASQRGKWFDDGLTKAYEYAQSQKNLKIAKEGVMVDSYLEGFLDGIAYFISEKHND